MVTLLRVNGLPVNVKLLGPVQLKVAPVCPVAVKVNEPPAQTLSADAVRPGAGTLAALNT